MRTRALLLFVTLSAAACSHQPSPSVAAGDSMPADHASPDHAAHTAQQAAGGDSAFAALQQRGQTAMGVDQYASSHRFDPLPDGGRIELQMDAPDSAATARIRAHLQEIAGAFARGDFATPGFVHAQRVPGTDVMAAKRAAITYRFAPLPRGGEVRITTTDAEAVAALHAFLAFQRSDHRTDAKQH